jgi:putative transposase
VKTKSVGKKEAKPGRKKMADEIRELILKLARETGAGYSKILGELKKLGINRVCRSTVVNILKENGLDPGLKRGEGTWDDFVKRHAETLWATDFFSKKVWTKNGLVEFFVLFFIHVATRRVHVAGMTPNPNSSWMAQQARNMNSFFDELPERPTLLIRDHDSKFTAEFDMILKSEGIEPNKVGQRATN